MVSNSLEIWLNVTSSIRQDALVRTRQVAFSEFRRAPVHFFDIVSLNETDVANR